MKDLLHLLAAIVLTGMATLAQAATGGNPEAVAALLDRIGGDGTAERFVTVVDETLADNGKDVFVITSEDGKPCVKGSSVIAVTTGINWYLNHHARVNLSWNNLSTDLAATSLPVPAGEERHACEADYRYYLNYCTFSYSMSTWTWERWQQEIDWMALHGINMPLQVVGLDAVWHKLLTEKYGYTEAEAGKFIAGPCFQAWWGMNNLEGWGGPNPQWWYGRQETLCKKILARERELGMDPVLPGYSGMVPSDFASKTGKAANGQGNWCQFVRPYILDPNSTAFAEVSADYYAALEEVMGTSAYYSMDPFHEGANTSGIDVPAAYKKIAEAMYAAQPTAKWVIQYWQWSGAQYNVLDQVEKGRLVVLDLFSDAHTHFGEYKGHDAVWCMLPNFGGRTGFMGRFNGTIDGYFAQKAAYANVKGVGATPEAIESVPVLYDLLFELPWHDSKPDAKEWMKDYAARRYGVQDGNAETAWELLRTTALDCRTQLQGPHEAVVCARPSLTVGSVSSWGGTDIFYDAQAMADAAHRLLAAELDGANYSYDLTDVARQALTDYGYYLLKAINDAHTTGQEEAFGRRKETYLQLILDLDELLCTNRDFMLGRWTQLARGIADEAAGTTAADREWLELDNARTLITTWGDRGPAEWGGLRDYSYREWGGMMKDFYYPRWKYFFDNDLTAPDWFQMEWDWAHDATKQYDDTPVGDTREVAGRLLGKYFLSFEKPDGSTFYAYRAMETDKRADITASAFRGTDFTCPVTLPEGTEATLSIDCDNDGIFSDAETVSGTAFAIPADAATAGVKARLALEDGTALVFTVALKDEITEARDVTVQTADAAQGSAAIEGTDATTVHDTDYVTLRATPATGYDFEGWTNAAGETVSTDNPFTYYGKDAETFTAHFIVNKWGSPEEDTADMSDIRNYNQYVKTMTLTQNDETKVIYEAAECPTQLFNTLAQRVTAARGSSFTLDWTDAGGLQYTYLSAYIDLDGDGEFGDGDELLAVKGALGQTSSAPCAGPLKVLLPYDMTTGITHLRLRFDGAWKDGCGENGAFPAKATANRMVYDVIVEVTEQAAQACTIGVVSSDASRGTVDANGQPDTYIYGPGMDVVFRAYPAEGYKLDRWEDRHGRALPAAWTEGNTVRFKPVENGTYTAVFVPSAQLAYGDWNFSYEEAGDGVIITGIEESGSGLLDFSQPNSLGKALVAVDPGTWQGNSALTHLVLPASDTGFDRFIRTSHKGDGTQATLTPTSAVPAAEPWTLRLWASTDGSSFNQWGSCLFATGTDPFAYDYSDGFQLYLAKAGTITMKLDGNAENKFSTPVGEKFCLEMKSDGKGGFTVTLTAADGTKEVKRLSGISLGDIAAFCTALPAGVNIDLLDVTDPTLHSRPWKGCTALTDIDVAEGNAAFSSVDGVLFSADGTTLRTYPEGRYRQRTFTLRNAADGLYVTATPTADKDGLFTATDYNNAARRVATAARPTPASLVRFAEADGKQLIFHFNSQGYFGGKAGNGGEGQQIEVLTNPQWAGDYEMAILQDFDASLTAQVALRTDGFYLHSSEGRFALAADAPETARSARWELQELGTIAVNVSDAGWTSLCLPVPAIVPAASEATVYEVTGAKGDRLDIAALAPGTVLAAGEGVLVEAAAAATVSFPIAITAEAAPRSGNLLEGALLQRTGLTAGTFYTLGTQTATGMVRATGTDVEANSAYLTADALGTPAYDFLSLDGGTSTAISSLPADGQGGAEALYDLRGRRVLYPAKGLYVTRSGQKVFMK